MAVVEKAERASGILADGGQISDVERGGYDADLTNDWSFNGALAMAAETGALR